MGRKKVQAALLIVVLFSVFTLSAAAGGSTEEVHTSFKAGKGYCIGDDVSFLVNYHLFRRPTGISRFPDGGISRTVAEGVFQVSMGPEGAFRSRRISDTRVSGFRLYSLEDSVFSGHEEHEEFDINRTNQLMRELGPAALGLPSPLDYCEKSRKKFIKDLIELKGDYQYRKEIIRRLDFDQAEAGEILTAMEKHQAGLKDFAQDQYRFYSEDTKVELRKQGGLE
ncbi:hypothetical protein [Marispirochaeta sp.]|uniref:hypothetical protein n=1 Tax=Marispirochaeta sp. TaxID=2038653 RepID=UPI0029C7AC6F|nr:hypothetical protein [Marispirochaeta sp.]